MKVAGQTVDLELPRRPSVRVSITTSARENQHHQQTAILVVAAALFLCWDGVDRKAGAPKYRHNVLDYGAEVVDWLVGLGTAAGQSESETMLEIITAGNAALDLIVESMVSQEDLVQAQGNSPAPTGSGSARSSVSSAPTEGEAAG